MTDVQLTSKQKEAVEFGEGPLLIVAGAGTGKTLVITQRIANIIHTKMARPEEILALTFTEKAAAEMSERVDVLLPYGFTNVPISTFHAFGDAILREFGLELGLNPDFQVLSQAEQFLFFREHIFDFPLKKYRPLSDPTRFIQAMLNVISRAKDEDIFPEKYTEYVRNLKNKIQKKTGGETLLEELERQEEIAGTYALYQELLSKEGKADFGDQVTLTLRLFRERPTVLKKIQQRYRFILVDEFQDTNYAQFQLIQLIGGDQANITVVGDDDQSIYKFRGAAISNILSFMDIYSSAKQIVLIENFRSSQVILDTAYTLITHNNPDRLEVKNQIDKKLKALSEGGQPVEHFHCDTMITESDQVAAQIADLVDTKGSLYSDIAILVRANNAADPFIRALNMREIPWRFSGNRGLYNRLEIKLLISFLKVITDPNDSVSLFLLASSEVYQLQHMEDLYQCMNLAHRQNRSLYHIFQDIENSDELSGLSADSLSTFQKIIRDVQDYVEISRNQMTGVVLYQFLTQSNYLKRLTQNESVENQLKIQNISRFFDVIWSYSQVAREDRILFFIRYLDLIMEAGDDPGTAEADMDTDAVQILTVHKAKGLEWPVVFMVSLIHHRFPTTRRRNPIELPDELIQEKLPSGDFHLQEERRLFYVGMTRAKERLYFTSAKDYGGIRQRKLSPFVLEALDRPHLDEINIRTRAEDRIHQFKPVSVGYTQKSAPIPEDSILNLSHYQIDDYTTCPLKYKYVHILRLPFFHHTIVYGKAIHSAIEVYYRHKINNLPVVLEDLHKAYTRAWKNIGFLSQEHEERRFEAGKNSIKRFFEREEASGSLPVRVEEKFSFMMGTNRIVGRWDRIDNRDGQIVIVDFKSSEVHQQDAADKRVKDSMQLIIYAMAYASTFNHLPNLLELHFLESGLVGRTEITDKMLEKAKEMIAKAAQGLRQHCYEAKPNYQSCRFCAFMEICPAAVRS